MMRFILDDKTFQKGLQVSIYLFYNAYKHCNETDMYKYDKILIMHIFVIFSW